MSRRRRFLLAGGIIIVVLLLVALAGGTWLVRRTFPTTQGSLNVAGLQAEVQVYRDAWGIPYIYAQNRHDLFFAQGYVHAQDRLWQMDFHRRIGQGRLSEIFGKTTLKTDRFLRTIGLARAAQADLENTDANTRAILQAYADGVNAYISTHQGKLPLEFTILGYKPEPWRPVDTLVWGKVMAWDLGGNWEEELLRARLIQKLGRDAAPALYPSYPQAGPFIIPPEVHNYAFLGQPRLDSVAQALALAQRVPSGGSVGLGSNNWVVDGSKSTTGKPLLANDPHLSIQMPSIWYENGLHGGGIDVVGATFPGTPGVVIGHNARIAWGVTNLGPDVQDIFLEKLNPSDPRQYEFAGRWEKMTVIQETIRVKGQDKPETLDVRLTRHGPLLNDVVEGLEQPAALKWTAIAERGRLVSSLLKIDQATDWQSFRDALRLWDAPSQNFVYADVDGHIGYQAPGRIPIRAKGQGMVPVPGWSGEYEWTDYIPFDELPSVLDPPTHFVATANNQVVPDSYPYLLTHDWSAPYRAMRITEQLTAKSKLSADDFRDIQADTLSLPAKQLIPLILGVKADSAVEEKALAVLKDWDYRHETDRAGAAIFQVFYWRLVQDTFGDELGADLLKEYLDQTNAHHMAIAALAEQPDNAWWDDVTTPERETRDQMVDKAFSEAVGYLNDRLGGSPDQWAWGRLHQSVFNHPLGAVKPLDRIFNKGPVPTRGSGFTPDASHFNYNKPFNVTSLSSYRQIVDVGDWDRSRSIHTTGQSGLPFDKHYGDMITTWQAVKYHQMLWSEKAVQENSTEHLTLLPAQ